MSDQNNQRQIDDLLAFGVARENIYTDTASGRNMERPGWAACRKALRGGDLLVVHAIDRLGRDLVQVVGTVNWLHEMGADIKALTTDLDTRTPTGRLVFHIMAAMSQWERELIVERTKHGLEKARQRGAIGGRPILHPADVILEAHDLHGMSGGAKKLGMSLAGFRKAYHRALAEEGAKDGPGPV